MTLTGVDPSYVAANPPNASQAPYTWTDRNYYIRLPANYDKNRAYPVIITGGICGNTDGKAGAKGGLVTLPSDQDVAIQIALSYVFATGGAACFAEDTAETTEPLYFDAVLADVQANYCVERSKVFAGGFDSGGNEAALLGCARSGKLRGIGTAGVKHRLDRPACTEYPVAAMMIAGLMDQTSPIAGDTGSGAARDDVLQRNGCASSQSKAWNPGFPDCVSYTDCPAAFPVVWCALDDAHSSGGTYSSQGFWKFWSELPAP